MKADEIINHLKGVEASAKVLQERCYRLRKKLEEKKSSSSRKGRAWVVEAEVLAKLKKQFA